MTLGLESGGAGAAGALAAAGLAAAYWLHAPRSPAGRRLLVLRAAGAAALALAVLRPVVSLVETRETRPRLLILLDAGATMRGKSGRGTRFSQAVDWLTRARGEIEKRADASVVLVSDRARPLGGLSRLGEAAPDSASFSPLDSFSDLGASEGPPPARVWLVSDGGAEGGDQSRAFAGLGAPVDALGVGPARRERGAAFTDLATPDFAFLHGTFSVGASIEASDLAGRPVAVTLYRADDGAPGGWREEARQTRTVSSDLETFTSSFTATAERLGAERWRLEARSGDMLRTREFRVEVVRQKYRIMYLAGRPSSEYAFLRDFLKSDPNRELVSFVILRNPENPSPASDRDLSLIPFPVDDIFLKTLPQFDLFILENFSAARFHLPPAHLEALKRFVAGGGALLVKGGENAFGAGGYKGSPLEEVLPVTLSNRSPDFVPGLFAPKPVSYEHPLVKLFDTPEESRKAWDALPPLDGWGRFASTRAGAQVVATQPRETSDDGSPLPVIAVRSYGRGKVMLVSTDSTWRWKLGAAQDRLASGVYERFWTRAVQYLTGSLDLSKVKFAPLPDRVAPREPFVASLRVFDEDFSPAKAAETRVTVLWTPPGGAPREVAARETEPGSYAVELTGLTPGTHRLRATARVRGRPWGEDSESFLWEAAADAPMDRAWLTRAAASGGGEFFDLARADAVSVLAKLPPPRPESEVARRLHPFSSAPWLAFTAILLLLEWALRRRKGMPEDATFPVGEGTLVFAAFALLGIVQAAPSVTTGDSGEFAAAAATLGVAHAPGYPLFVLLGKAFGTALPFGSWAYRTNVLSALCGAAALALFGDALRRFGAGRAARLGAVAVLGLSPQWREQSAVTEVFSLHLLCAALLLWIVAAAGERILESGPAAALGLVFGLGLGDHQTLALILPALLLAGYGRGAPGRWPRALFCAAAGTLAGFAVNAALPLRAAQSPPLDWDHATTLKAFWRLLARKDYGTLALTVDGGQAAGVEGLAAQAWRSARGVAGQLGPFGAGLALFGAAAWRRAELRLRSEAVWAWIICAGPAFLMLGRPPFDAQTSSALERFHLLPLVGACVFVAAGIEICSRLRPAAGAAAALAAAGLLAPAAAAQSRRGDFLAHDYGRTILRELPPNAQFVMDGGDDTFYSLAFLQFAQREREDAALFDRGGVVFHGAYGADFLALPHESKEARRREVEGRLADGGRLWYSTLNPGLLPGWDMRPAGLVRRPLRPGAAFPEAAALDETLPSPRAPDAARRYRDRALLAFVSFSRGAAAFARRDADAGLSWFERAADAGGDALWVAPAISYALALSGYEASGRKDWAAAERIYRAQAALDPGRAEPLINLGVVLQGEKRWAEAEAALREAAGRAPRAPRVWETLGALLWARARWPECAESYASAAALPAADPGDAGWAAKARARAGADR